MKLFNKILLVVLLISCSLNVYAIDWKLGFFHEENTKFLLAFSAGLVGIILIFVLNAWAKINKTSK